MMSNSTIFLQQPSNFQFLSVCHYINTFGIIFYNKQLIALEERNHSVSVLNTLFQYLHNSANEFETKLELVQKVLKGSDLYGGGEDETLDMKYVNGTYQYIISNALFSHFGYINGYLAGIINKVDNVTYSFLKKKVFQDLSENYTSTNFCLSGNNKSIKLTSVAVKKIFYDHIWPIFPEPDEDMSIMDVNYLYAMVGLKIVRSVTDETSNFTFHDYILLSRQIDLGEDYENGSYEMVLNFFSTPALFFFAYNKKETFREESRTLPLNNKFWSTILENLFLHINSTMHQSVNEVLSDNLYWNLEKEMEKLENRTTLATNLLRKCCQNFRNNGVPTSAVALYKTLPNWFINSPFRKNCRLCDLPNLDKVYAAQFTQVRNPYKELQKNLIRKVLTDGYLMEILNSNVTVKLAKVPDFPGDCDHCIRAKLFTCMNCHGRPRQTNSDIYLLFAIIGNETNFYALRQVKMNLILLESKGLEGFFAKIVANDSSLQMETEKNSKVLKNNNEDSEAFVQRIADMKAEEFIQNLKEYDRNPTTGEKIFYFLKYLVPFYNCVESIRSNDVPEALFSCSLDILSLIPMAGVVTEYLTKLTRSLLVKTGEMYLAQTLTKAGTGIEMVTLYQMSQAVAKTVAKEILTREVLKDFSIASLRTVDPGFEHLCQLSRYGFKLFKKTYQRMFSSLLKTSKNAKLLMTLKSVLKSLKTNTKLAVDHTGLVPKVIDQRNNYKVIRYYYPRGDNYFGPTCVSSFGKTAELRSIEGNSFQIPVMTVKSIDVITYRPYSPEFGKVSEVKFEIGENDLLRRVLGATEWNDMKFERNYQVYYHTVHWEKRPDSNIAEGEPVNPGTSRASISDNLENSRELEKPSTTRNVYISVHGQETYDKYLRALEEFKKKGFSGIREDKETLATLRKSVEVISVYQTMDDSLELPKDLYFSQTLRTSLIDRYLKKIKIDKFYFNDITIITDIPPEEIILKKRVTTSLKTEVRYNLKLDHSHYGFIDLALFHDNFKHQFIAFPEIKFDIINAEFHNGRDILVLELKPESLGIEEWMKIRKREDILQNSGEKIQSTRAESIENAAFEISLKTPLHRFTDSKKRLEEYILKIDDSVSHVPTYGMLAQDIFADFTDIPDKYDEWKITKNIFIEDVLFQTELHHIRNLKSAEERIGKIFGKFDQQSVKALFDNYSKLPNIRHNVIFEDYFVIYSVMKGILTEDVQAFTRFEVSTYRLALRQSGEEIVKKQIALYKPDYLSNEIFKEILENNKESKFWKFKTMIPAYSKIEFAVRNIPSISSSGKFVLLQLEIKNRAGIAEIGRLGDFGNVEFYVPEEIEFEVKGVTKKTIEGRDVFVVTLRDKDMPTEKRIVKIVNKLNKILSTDTVFYVNGNEKLSTLLKENNFLLSDDFYNIPKQLFKQSSDYKTIFGKNLYSTVYEFLQKFKQNGLSAFEDDKKMLGRLRQSVDILSYYQIMEAQYKLPTYLQCSQTIKNSLIVNYLKNLKGKEFYFNDITLAKDVPLGGMFPESFSSISSNTEVRYHMKFDSHIGLVDLGSFHEDFIHQFIIFPEVVFYVKDAKFYNARNVLVLELVKKPMKSAEWIKLHQRENSLLDARDMIQSKRAEVIENVAFDISLNNPLNKFTEVEKVLREYILETDDIVKLVPDYKMLAKYISQGNEIPELYKQWKITNYNFIDDVLFQEELHQIGDLDSATRIINIIFDCVYVQNIEPVFDIYHKSSIIRHYLTFEDYYVIYSEMIGTLMKDVHAPRRFEASIYRLALKQCGEELIKNPITVYNALNVPVDDFKLAVGQTGEIKTFHHTNPFFTRDEFIRRLSRNTVNPFRKTLIYKVNIKNQAGIVDLGRLNGVPNQHILLEETEFMIEGLSKETIEGREYDVLTLYDLETVPKETRMVKIINKLNELFSTNTKFYVNVQEIETY